MDFRKQELQTLCKRVMNLNHIGVQCDDIHCCEEMHQTIREIDKMDRHEAVRLLMHVIHVQQLQLVGAKVEHDNQNDFTHMVFFDSIESYIENFPSNTETLY